MFFDAGETLVHPEPSFPELFAKVVRDAGHHIEAAQVEDAVGLVTRRMDAAARDGKAWSTSPERSREFWFAIYASFLQALSIPDSELLRAGLYETFSDPANYSLFPDALPAIESLDAAGFSMGVISNFEAWLDGLLDGLAVGEYLPVRAISGLEGVEKPDAALFEVALERAGLAPGDCAYVGDNPLSDMEPAAALGMFPVLIDRNGRHPGSPHARIASLTQLPEVLAR